jgi:hypothetical protein
MANTITKFTNGSSFTIKIPHLEGQEVFGSTKWRANIAQWLKCDSHMHDHVNFFWPRVNTTPSGFVGSNVDANKSNGIVRDEAFVLTFEGLRVQECVCRDGVWRIERCPPSLNTHYFATQRDPMKHCDTKIIAKKTIRGILVHAMMVCGLIWKGLQQSVTSFGFVHMIWFIVLEEPKGSIVSISHLSHQHGQCK